MYSTLLYLTNEESDDWLGSFAWFVSCVVIDSHDADIVFECQSPCLQVLQSVAHRRSSFHERHAYNCCLVSLHTGNEEYMIYRLFICFWHLWFRQYLTT